MNAESFTTPAVVHQTADSPTLLYAMRLGQNARRVVARVRATSSVAAVRAFSRHTGIPSAFINAAEISL
jgi:hypothetical protein